MKPEQLEELLRYRIEQAHETLREAEVLLDASALRGVINRAYIGLFDREFVRTNLLPRHLSRSLHPAFDRRQMHDYGEAVMLDRQAAEETLRDARVFVAAAEAYLLC